MDEEKKDQNTKGEFIINEQIKEDPPNISEEHSHKHTHIENPTGESLKPREITTLLSNHPKKSKAHFYTSFMMYPVNVKFPDQDPDEDVIILVRRHIITNIPWMVLSFFFAITPPLIIPFLTTLFPFFQIAAGTQTALALSYNLFILGYILVNFSIWYFHASLVTNKRIIDVDLDNILTKHVSETRISLIQDVSYTQVGAIRSIFNYGDVFIQTAGPHPNIEFDKSPQPALIARIIGDLIHAVHKI